MFNGGGRMTGFEYDLSKVGWVQGSLLYQLGLSVSGQVLGNKGKVERVLVLSIATRQWATLTTC